MFSRSLAAAGLLSLAACQTTQLPQAGSLDAGFGEVTKHNAAVQIIDPDPVYTAEDAQPGDNGDKAADAARRYRTDNVKDTEPANTRRRGGGSGPR